jgi:dienelactone hydrolase
MRSIIGILILLFANIASAAIQTKTIEYKDGDTKLVGTLAWDDARRDEKRPGIVVFPEWWGVTDYPKTRAKQLAELGYVALAADIYGNAQTTSDPKEAGQLAGVYRADRNLLRSRAKAGLESLKAQANVDSSKIAAIGYCFGGTTAIELGMSGADLALIGSFHGSLAFPQMDDMKNIKGKVLIFNGAADTFVKPEEVTALTDALSKSKVKWTLLNFSGAVHAFTNPNADAFNIPGIAYDKNADNESWMFLKNVLAEKFGAAHASG